jgi:hypothetical protein
MKIASFCRSEKLFRSLLLAGFTALAGCQVQEIPQPLPVVAGPIQSERYLLSIALQPGFSGTLELGRVAGQDVQSTLTLSGMIPGRRYFGRLSRSNAADFSPPVDFADLGETGSGGIVTIRLPKDYVNQPILFDSLINSNTFVRILESEPGKGGFREVLRGDIGSNVLKSETLTFGFNPGPGAPDAGGTMQIVQRKNLNCLLALNPSGLPAGQNLKLNLFRGVYETGSFERVATLGTFLTSSTEVQRYPLPYKPGSLNFFDTLQGFVALENDSQKLAVASFGGNRVTGSPLEFKLVGPADSALRAKVVFEALGSGAIRMKFLPVDIPAGNEPLYLGLHRNTVFDNPDTLQTWIIPRTGSTFFQNIRPETGIRRLEDIRDLDACFRVSEDRFNANNPVANGDIGQNEVELSFLEKAALNIPVSEGFGGSLLFRKRRNQEVLFFYKLSNSQGFIENRLVIRQGPRPSSTLPSDTTQTLFRLAVFPGANGGPVNGSSNLQKPDGSRVLWSDLLLKKSEGAYPEHFFDDSGDFYLLSRGEWL